MQVGQEKSFPLTLLGWGLGVKLIKDVNKEKKRFKGDHDEEYGSWRWPED